jgi:hypothetical protein
MATTSYVEALRFCGEKVYDKVRALNAFIRSDSRAGKWSTVGGVSHQL